MGKKHLNVAAAHARQARWQKYPVTNPDAGSYTSLSASAADAPIVLDLDSDCKYTGGVDVSDVSDSDYESSEKGSDSDSLSKLERDELEENLKRLQAEVEAEIAELADRNAFEHILKAGSTQWKKAEKTRGLGYNGQSKRTKEWRAQQARASAKVQQEAKSQYRLQKKGVGRGLHQSDVICSICGHLVDAGETLEYGKNYDGYWTGERFCKQVILNSLNLSQHNF